MTFRFFCISTCAKSKHRFKKFILHYAAILPSRFSIPFSWHCCLLGGYTSTLGDLESYANRLALGPTFAAHWQPRGGQEQVGRSIFGPFAAGTRVPPATSRYHSSITDHPTNASEWGRDLSRFTTGICSTPWSCISHWWGWQGALGSGVHFEEPCGRWRLDSKAQWHMVAF